MGRTGLIDKLSVANVLHSANLDAVSCDWIEEYELHEGKTDVTAVNPEPTTFYI